MSDMEGPRMLSEIEERQVMRSFQKLFDLCVNNPGAAAELLTKMANTPDTDPYPDDAGAYFMFGIFFGICGYKLIGNKALHDAIATHQEYDGVYKPEDFLGPRRKFGKK